MVSSDGSSLSQAGPAAAVSPAPAIEAADQTEVFAALADPAFHGTSEPVQRIDTHSAVVFLAGPFAYKVKRAVWFPFLDFSTREKRRAACAAEVEVNHANAPGLYLGVVPIVRTASGLAFGVDDAAAAGEVIEHAVKMRRFDTAATLDHLVEKGPLPPALVAALAHTVAAAHAAAPRRTGWDVAPRLAAYASDNDAVFAAHPDLFDPIAAHLLAARSADALARIRPLLATRAAAGGVRRCHGDLHLRNIVLADAKPVLFDAVEFSEDIATCDVLYDLAFLLMDLWQRGHRTEANGVLNRYLWAGADDEIEAQIDGLAALPLFISLRAAIRAKVEAAGLAHLGGGARAEAQTRVRHLFQEACAALEPGAGAALWAVGGLSGSGKSTFAQRLAPDLGPPPGAVILRSDIERKRLFGTGETERLPPEAYTAQVTEQVYGRLRKLAARALAAGACVIVDAVHAREAERDAIEQVAREAAAPFTGIWLDAPPEELMKRVAARTNDASDADGEVVRRQLGYDLGAIRWHREATRIGLAGDPPVAD